ncbi:hypothetical protein BH11PLA1_BH11PLA1_00800 [soil metagenome]
MKHALGLIAGLSVAVVSVAALAQTPAPSAAASDAANETAASGRATPTIEPGLLKRLEALDLALARVESMRADFVQRKKTAMLKKPIESSGTLVALGPVVKWETTKPNASSLRVGDGELRLFYPADKLLEVYPAEGDARALAGVPLPRLAVLRERFDIVDGGVGKGEAGKEGDLVLVLTPREGKLKRAIRSLRVEIDPAGPGARRVVIVDGDGDTTEITFTNVRVNSGVSAADVELVTPKGTKVVHPLGEKGAGTTGAAPGARGDEKAPEAPSTDSPTGKR